MQNDNDEAAAVIEEIELSGETKNCYVFEPQEGSEIVSKVYIRKSVFTGKPRAIQVYVHELD